MDNLSHTLAGLAAGEFIHRLLPAEGDAQRESVRHRLLLITAALAGNFPDLDLVLSPLLPAPLGYLLHHRGHTHTLLYAIPQMLLLSAALLLFWPNARRLLQASRTACAGFLLALLLGFGLHLAMDFLNSYGLHPFHPLDSRWFYGDMVFILEPMFWIALGAPLAISIASRRWRLVWILLLLAVPLYFTVKAYLAWPALLMLYAAGLLGALAQFHAGQRGTKGIVAGVLLLGLFLGAQFMASWQAERMVHAEMHARSPGAVVHDVALTAFPSHPLCWVFAAIESDESKDTYWLARGAVSVLPQVLPVGDCPRALNPVQERSEDRIAIVDEISGSLKTLRATQAENCFFDAWLRFARMPLLEQRTATDVRFSSSLRGNFTTVNLDDFDGAVCPGDVPQWGYPRADILDPLRTKNGNGKASQ